MRQEADRLVRWLDARLAASAANGFVVGLSGGIDSAVVVRLCQLARKDATVAVLLPCHSDPQDEEDARLVATHFGLRTTRIDLAAAYDALLRDARGAMAPLAGDTQAPPDDIRARLPGANLKPRLRMTALYFVANSLNYVVVGTGNRSELTIGYFTKWGDGGVDLLPLGHLVKSQVRALARTLGVPQRVIDKPPSAGLWLGQTDEGEMGFTYEDLERYLESGPEAVSPAVAMKIERLARASEHKRAPAPIPD
ncbi:MAG TPA: NAD(+) synthase [Vicinamibacterales bacterium]|nr:NAD(+) synthase [Vicinamibacterales bacterium]